MLHPGQIVRGRLPLLSPAFRHTNLRRQIPPLLQDAKNPFSEGWNYGLEYCPFILAEMTISKSFVGSLTYHKSATWDRRLYFLFKGRRAENFFFPLI